MQITSFFKLSFRLFLPGPCQMNNCYQFSIQHFFQFKQIKSRLLIAVKCWSRIMWTTTKIVLKLRKSICRVFGMQLTANIRPCCSFLNSRKNESFSLHIPSSYMKHVRGIFMKFSHLHFHFHLHLHFHFHFQTKRKKKSCLNSIHVVNLHKLTATTRNSHLFTDENQNKELNCTLREFPFNPNSLRSSLLQVSK